MVDALTATLRQTVPSLGRAIAQIVTSLLPVVGDNQPILVLASAVEVDEPDILSGHAPLYRPSSDASPPGAGPDPHAECLEVVRAGFARKPSRGWPGPLGSWWVSCEAKPARSEPTPRCATASHHPWTSLDARTVWRSRAKGAMPTRHDIRAVCKGIADGHVQPAATRSCALWCGRRRERVAGRAGGLDRAGPGRRGGRRHRSGDPGGPSDRCRCDAARRGPSRPTSPPLGPEQCWTTSRPGSLVGGR
jgi:hypothetical protein